MNYSISEISEILGTNPDTLNNPKAIVSQLLTDSRSLFYPAETLFFALETKNNDGHKFVKELYDLNVRNFVVQKIMPGWELLEEANFLQVKDSLLALQKLTASHRKRFNIPVIGITGSNGKTIVKEWTFQLLESVFNISRSPRSYNSQIGVPLSVWQLDTDTQIGLFEAGISMSGEMESLEKMIVPTIGIITNIGDAHQENFSTLKQKCLEKLELFANCNIIICEENDRLIEECMVEACLSQKRYTWSMVPSDYSQLVIEKVVAGTPFSTIHYSFLNMGFSVEVPFSDETSIRNVTEAIAVALYLHVPLKIIKEKLLTLEPVAMRLDVREGKNGTSIINDTYNSDINSLKIAIDFLVQRAADTKKKKTLVISDILQSGVQTKSLYSRVNELIKARGIDKLIGVGPVISEYADIFKNEESHFFKTTEEFLKSEFIEEFSDEVILLKGSRLFRFEQISELLERKTHETVLDVNLDAIVHNFNFYRSRLKPETKLICMLKADGYGTGSIEIAKTLQYHKCDYIAVAIAEEGANLRREGIRLPIIVLNPEVNGFDELFNNRLEPEVYNFRILEAFIKEAQKRGITNYPIHLKLDTGMHRLGFTQCDIAKLTDTLNKQKGLRVQSIFSHLAASESWNFDSFTNEQMTTFKNISEQIKDAMPYPIMTHILNSAGIERFPDAQMNMVRLGISLYGVSASGLEGLQNVCTLKSTILQIKNIPSNETIGYGRKGVLDHDARIATIRIGYADGLDRRFGNGVGKVLVNRQLAPFVGNICMDLSMIDITGIEAKEGDSVIIFGEHLSLIDLSKAIETIPYEILTSISSRVKQVFYRE